MKSTKILKSQKVQFSKDQKFVKIQIEGSNDLLLIPTNLMKSLFEIPYTRKDGTQVTAKDFKKSREASEARLTAWNEKNKKASS